MSRSPGKGKDALEGPSAESVSSYNSGSEDEDEDEEREETPDLYRNSALGMYGGVSNFYPLLLLAAHVSPGDGRHELRRGRRHG